MHLPSGDIALAEGYRSASQKARVISEAWIEQRGYCLQCNNDRLRPTLRNTPARDFECTYCSHPYELKSSSTPFRRRIVDGAYASMMQRILNSTVPSFLLLQYQSDWRIRSVSAIHHALITPSIIEQRKPLSMTAKRAGWIGCNILLSSIPPEGRIVVINAGIAIPKEIVRENFAATEKLATLSLSDRGWTSALLVLLHKMNKYEFTLQDAYGLESQLASEYPTNKHIRSKIRQQLQVLRDKGLLQFLGAGVYRFSSPKPT